MHLLQHPYQVYPLGDAAVTIDFGNRIEEGINQEVIARFIQLQQHPPYYIREVIPAYSSLTICFDITAIKKYSGNAVAADWVKKELETILAQPVQAYESVSSFISIPVCYEKEFAPDLQRVALAKKLSIEQVIDIHTSVIYRVYMLGFLPGFAYLGQIDDRIAVPRKPQPVHVKQGSVGLAGRQTGVYPLDSPGGWQIIGRSPVRLFHPGTSRPVLLKCGDSVQFYSITKKEFEQLSSGL